MKNMIKFTASLLLLALYFVSATEAEAQFVSGDPCVTQTTPDGLEEITTDVEMDGPCTVTPDFASFPLFKIGLCSEIPTYESYQEDCSFIVDNEVAQDLEIIKGNSQTITDNVSVAPGSYRAAVILLGNEISLKHTAVFAVEDYYGWTGGVSTSGGTSTEGDSCATNSSEGSEDDIGTNFGGFFSCGGDDITAGWFTEISGAYLATANGSPAVCSINTVTGAIVPSSPELAFETSSGTSVVCGMDDASTLETYEPDGTPNATRQLVVQTFDTPVVISRDATSIDLGIKLDNMLSLETHLGPDSQLDGDSVRDEYLNGFIDGIEFRVSVQ